MPLWVSDVDTDQIMPKQFLTRIDRSGYGAFIFDTWRREGGSPFDAPERAGASILLAGPNFGCGSSREHAVWGLQQWGIRAIVAPGFGDIFRRNCTNAGVATLTVATDVGARLCETATADPEAVFEVDVQHVRIRSPLGAHSADVPARFRTMLLRGVRDIDLTLDHVARIDAHEAQRPRWMPATRRSDELSTHG